jgi:hypothetical protein
MKRKPRAQLYLPPLSPDDALRVVDVIERLASAIWRAHGPQMVARLHHSDRPQPLAAGRIGHPAPDSDDDVPA